MATDRKTTLNGGGLLFCGLGLLACGEKMIPPQSAPIRSLPAQDADPQLRFEVILCSLYTLDGSTYVIDAGEPDVQELISAFATEHRKPWTALVESEEPPIRLLRFGRALHFYDGPVDMVVEQLNSGSQPIRFLASFERSYGNWEYAGQHKRVTPLSPESLDLLSENPR